MKNMKKTMVSMTWLVFTVIGCSSTQALRTPASFSGGPTGGDVGDRDYAGVASANAACATVSSYLFKTKCLEAVNQYQYFDDEAAGVCGQISNKTLTSNCINAIGNKHYASGAVKACIDSNDFNTMSCLEKVGTINRTPKPESKASGNPNSENGIRAAGRLSFTYDWRNLITEPTVKVFNFKSRSSDRNYYSRIVIQTANQGGGTFDVRAELCDGSNVNLKSISKTLWIRDKAEQYLSGQQRCIRTLRVDITPNGTGAEFTLYADEAAQ